MNTTTTETTKKTKTPLEQLEAIRDTARELVEERDGELSEARTRRAAAEERHQQDDSIAAEKALKEAHEKEVFASNKLLGAQKRLAAAKDAVRAERVRLAHERIEKLLEVVNPTFADVVYEVRAMRRRLGEIKREVGRKCIAHADAAEQIATICHREGCALPPNREPIRIGINLDTVKELVHAALVVDRQAGTDLVQPPQQGHGWGLPEFTSQASDRAEFLRD